MRSVPALLALVPLLLAGCERPTSPSLTGPDFTVSLPPGSIGDRVWFDANGNGAQNTGEQGLVGWTVTLLGSGAYVASQTTGANGAYLFTGLSSGSYRVCVQPRQGYVPSWDVDGVGTPNCAVVNLTQGGVRTDADFGYTQPLGGIGDRVWNDANGNRAPDAGEAGLAGWLVRITGASLPAGYVATRSTLPSGAYAFTGLPGGTYQVCVTAKPGYTQTFDLDGTATPHCATVTLSPGQTRSDLEFGYWQPGSIGDRVWNDANGNRSQEPSEAGLAGWSVTISGSALPAGYAAAQVTGATGAYAFAGLPAGTYRVCVAPQAGWTPTYDLDGTGTPHCAAVPLVAGRTRADADFGYRR